jgi:hypothetical protein
VKEETACAGAPQYGNSEHTGLTKLCHVAVNALSAVPLASGRYAEEDWREIRADLHRNAA